MAHVLAVAAQKGGVGKTTSTINLGAALAKLGRRVLLIDLDPQECMAAALGVPEGTAANKSMCEVLTEGLPLEATFHPVAGNMTLAPAGPDLAVAEFYLATNPAGTTTLRRALKPIADRFDHILIDCPPALGQLTYNGMVAAQQVLIPAQTEFLALRRIAAVMDTVKKIIEGEFNTNLSILGILPTMYDARTVHAREILEKLQKTLGGEHRVFDPIPRSVRFSEATVAMEPIISYAESTPGAVVYEQIAREVAGA